MKNKLINREAIAALILEGYSHQAIATAMDCSVSSVSMVARETSLQRRRNTQYVTLTDEEWSQLLAKLNITSISQLAREFGVSRSSIYKRIK